MQHITLEQHFYSSAPIGLGGGPGWQTVAQSREAGRSEDLEEHCVYYRPEPRKELEPESWGWYWLADGRVCLHRTVYSGQACGGRPGNFFSHDLLLAADALAPIDFDVVALLRWVREKSRVRYHAPGAQGTDGFACRHDQLYEKLGWPSDRLESIPRQDYGRLAHLEPLTAPVAELLNQRARLDQQFVSSTWTPLRRAVLGEAPLDALLLRAYLCPQEQRRPVLLRGFADGDNKPEAALRVVEFLFGLLPEHCRRNLTFSTYAGNQAGNWAMTPHWKRQLMMTTRWNEVRLPSRGQSNSSFWLIDAENGQHLLPPLSDLAAKYIQALERGKWEDLRRLRDCASHFDLQDETAGLIQAWPVFLGAGAGPPSAEVYEQYVQLAPRVKPGFPGFLKDSREKFLDTWPERGDPALFRKVARSYLAVAQTQYAGLQGEGKTAVRKEIATGMDKLLQLAFRLNSVGAQEDLLGAVSSRALTDLRDQILLSFATTLVGSERTVRPSLRPFLAGFVLPVLENAPLAPPQQLGQRLQLLRDIEGATPQSGGDLLIGLVKGKALAPDKLGEILKSDPAVIPRFYPEWAHAMKNQSFAAVAGKQLDSVAVLVAYWRAESLDLSAHVGTLQALSAAKKSAEVERRLWKHYEEDGNKCLRSHLKPHAGPGRSLREVSAQADVHVRLIGWLRGAAEVKGEESLLKHLADLLAMVLAAPLDGAPDSPEYLQLLTPPVKVLCDLSRGVPARTQAITRVGRKCALWRAHGSQLSKPRVHTALNAALEGVGVEKQEADWLAGWCCRVAVLPAEGVDYNKVLPDFAVQRLLESPDLAAAGDKPSALQRYLAAPEFARALGQKLLSECHGAPPAQLLQTIEQWFTPDGPRYPLLRLLEKAGVLDEKIASQLVCGLANSLAEEKRGALQTLAREEVPEVVAKLARQVIRQTTVARLRDCAAVVERARQPPQGIGPVDPKLVFEVKCLIEMSGEEEVDRYLDYLSLAAWSWQPPTFRVLAPELMLLFESAANRLQRSLDGMWARFFWGLASQRDGGRFRACYLATGEGLLGGDPMAPSALGHAESLALLHGASHLNGLFEAPDGQGVPRDALCDALSESPKKGWELDEETCLRARARLAAVIYDTEAPGPELADVCCRLAVSRKGEADPRKLAHALFGYLTLDGTAYRSLCGRARRLCHPRFWRPLRRTVNRATIRKTCDHLEDMLGARQLSPRPVRRLRRKEGLFGFLWNATSWLY